jgi:starvation-inducible DNA-binding protein
MKATGKQHDWVRTSGRSSAARRAGDAAAPLVGQPAPEIQTYSRLVPMPLALAESARRQSVEHLNQLLADLLTIRDLYKKHHWQVSGPTFYALHLLLDRHAEQLSELVDTVAERVMALGGVAVAVAADVAEITLIPRAPRGREDVPTQLWRLLHAHEIVLEEARAMARAAAKADDAGTNDLLVSDVIRTNEAQVWFLSEHLVDSPLLPAGRPAASNGQLKSGSRSPE